MKEWNVVLGIFLLLFCFQVHGQDTTKIERQADMRVRKRLTEPDLSGIKSDFDVMISLKLMIDENGQVLSVFNLSRTTTNDRTIIEGVIAAAKLIQFDKVPGNEPEPYYLTIKLSSSEQIDD